MGAQEERRKFTKSARESRQDPLWASLTQHEAMIPWRNTRVIRSSTAPAGAQRAQRQGMRNCAVATSANNRSTYPIVGTDKVSPQTAQVATDFGQANQLQ